MKMHQSHLHERRGNNAMSPEESQRQQLLQTQYQNRVSQNKNGYSHTHIRKHNQINSFGRIMPKHISHDKEYLYEENIKLKEKVRMLEDQNIKLKTRTSVAEKQKSQILSYYAGGEYAPVREQRPGSRSMGRHGSGIKSSIQNKNYAKKMIRQVKDEVENLKTENGRIKKAVKYTQILELQIENQRLLEETGRLEEYIRQIIENESYDEYEAEISELKKKIQSQKESSKNSNYQLRKKNDECEQLKEKMKQMQIKQVEKQKKLNRDLSLLRGEVQKQRDQKLSVVQKSINASHNQKGKKQKTLTIQECEKCPKIEKQLKNLKQQLIIKQKEIKTIKVTLEEKERQNTRLKSTLNKKEKQSQLEEKSEMNINSNIKSPQKSTPEKKIEKKKVQTEENDYNDEFEGGQVLELDSDKEKNVEQYNEQFNDEEAYDDDFGQAEEKKEEQKKKPEQEEEMLFQKQEKPKKKKSKEKQKQKNEKGKVDKIVKETITYKLMTQRYTYADFETDIKGSGVDEFSVQQLATMLNNEPFFLVDEFLQTVLTYCFSKTDIDIDDSLKAKTFLKKMKHFIGEFDLLPEKQEEKILSDIAVNIQKNILKYEKEFKKLEEETGIVNKKNFVSVLKNTGKYSDEKIQICLGEACLISLDINHINYVDFLKRFDEGGEPL